LIFPPPPPPPAGVAPAPAPAPVEASCGLLVVPQADNINAAAVITIVVRCIPRFIPDSLLADHPRRGGVEDLWTPRKPGRPQGPLSMANPCNDANNCQ